MNIIACIKQVPDTEARVQIADNSTSIVSQDINYILNPFDEFAVEEAIKTKENAGDNAQVTVISLGDESTSGAIRTALSMGADKGKLLKTGQCADDPLQVARAIAAEIASGEFDVIFFGNKSVGNEHGQVGLMVAEIIGIPSISGICELNIEGGKATGKREVEGGTETFECNLPAAFITQKGLNEPRYASLKGRMAAKKKTIDEKEINLGEPALVIENLAYPPERQRGRVLGEGKETVAELVRCLREEAKVI